MSLFSLRSIVILEQDERRKVLIRGVKSKGTCSCRRSHTGITGPSSRLSGAVAKWGKREQGLPRLETPENSRWAERDIRKARLSPEKDRAICPKIRDDSLCLWVFGKSPYCTATSVSSFLFITVLLIHLILFFLFFILLSSTERVNWQVENHLLFRL